MEMSDVGEGNSLQPPRPKLLRSGSTASGHSGIGGVNRKLQKGSTPRQRLTRSNTIHVLQNSGAAGDIEQHVEKDEKNHVVQMVIDVRVRKESRHTQEEVEMRREKLVAMFGTPCHKWNSRRKFPFKLTLQLLKVLVVTLQLATFFGERSTFEVFSKTNRDTFRHLFLKGELDAESGDDVVYTPDDLYEHVNHVLSQYYRFDEITLSNVLTNRKADDIEMDVSYFEKLTHGPNLTSFFIDPETDDRTYMIPDIKSPNCTAEDPAECYDIKAYLEDQGKALDLRRLIEFDLNMGLSGLYIKQVDNSIEQPIDDIECVDFKIAINYDNKDSGGQMKITLETELDVSTCKNAALKVNNTDPAVVQRNQLSKGALTAFDAFVILVCLSSLILALRTIIKRNEQMKITRSMFSQHYGYNMCYTEVLDFISLWYFFYVISDVLVITASILKLYIRYGAIIQSKTYNNEIFFDATGIMLGLANISEWISLIRYLGYSSQYYILILTISNALPELTRFLVCALTIFFGYTFAGWVVLGPYDPKYNTISGSMQSLFALMHGDDVYNTMQNINMEDHPTVIWVTAQIYHYTYTTLFIFAIANLFIAVIMDSYETVKRWQVNGMPKTFLHHFTDGTLNVITDSDTEATHLYHTEDDVGCVGVFAPLLCCRKCRSEESDEEEEETQMKVGNNNSNGYDTISGSMQSLFALIHGDDVYAAMQNINFEDHPTIIWLVAQFYHYSYCTLFIFAIANLFIAVIMDSYETVKKWQVNGMPKTFLHHFTDGTLKVITDPGTKATHLYHTEDDAGCVGVFAPILCCTKCSSPIGESEEEEEEEELHHTEKKTDVNKVKPGSSRENSNDFSSVM